MLMVYNQKNYVADGCHGLSYGGLSRYGHEVVRETNRVGMGIDVAHTGYRSATDTISASNSPVICNHANIAASNK